MSLPYRGELIQRAKELRKCSTPQEKHLWYDFLRTYPIRFQRQKTISSFIVDFYCAKAKLAIEIDGMQHYTEQGVAYDSERSAVLDSYGITVLRFSNYDVINSFNDVCNAIDTNVRYKLGITICQKPPS